ncbi:MAG: ComF family protein [Gammaproteobacteria bacterium]|nr:ComF family protein [Gammaproteobacteria bacterium]
MTVRWIDNLDGALRGLLLASRCAICAQRCGIGFSVCAECLHELPWNTPACPHCAAPTVAPELACGRCQRQPLFERAWAAWRLQGPIHTAILRLKYRAGFTEARWLAQAMLRRAPATDADLLLPVPLHPWRLRRRGYNQALELARIVGRELGLACDFGAAQRLRATADQIGKSAVVRRRNVRGAFAVSPRVAGHRVLLLDDVMTTGSTLAELARTCRRAGAIAVEVWTAARAA